MKRLFVLIVLLAGCICTSFGTPLTSEQKQLAWKFIHECLRNRESYLNKYSKDIQINLKGDITAEDSIQIKELIKDFRKAIPHLKIELSKQPGNLILELNEKQPREVKITMYGNNYSTTTCKTEFPKGLTSLQRKQLIYDRLFNAFTISGWRKKFFPGLEGSFFTEEKDQNMSFSPFDFYILEQLYSPFFSATYAKGIDGNLAETAWKSICWKFVSDANDPVVFRDAIKIKLEGSFGKKDLDCIKQLVGEVNELLPQKIQFVDETSTANLIFRMNLSVGVLSGFSQQIKQGSIKRCEVDFSMPKDSSDVDMKRVFYYHLYRALVQFSSVSGATQTISGCVFDVEKPKSVSFTSVDKFILYKLYSPDFKAQFKGFFVKTYGAKAYYQYRYADWLRIISLFGSFVLAILLFSILIFLKVFRKHNWNLRVFIVQLLCGVFIYDLIFLFYLSVKNFDVSGAFKNFPGLLINDVAVVVLALYFFVIEKRIFQSGLPYRKKLVLIILNTLSVSYFFLVLLSMSLFSGVNSDIYFYPLLFALAITTIRIFLFSLSSITRTEIQQKDHELSALRELHKQAELQSLRAKINPHFLYNALNSIASLATTDAAKTEKMALALSDFFKYAINREQKQMNSLAEELNAIRTYLEIEKVRFGERLSFSIDCPDELLTVQMPQLLIQPLVENAIKHGLSAITENGCLRIVISQTGKQLKIRVHDNGPAFPDGPLVGYGIQNTQERIALLYGSEAAVNWKNGAEKYIEISIPV